MTLGPISGLSAGWLLAGAGAATLPVAIHLLRRRSRRVMFPPARVLARQEAHLRGGGRLRERLLMALRVLIVALVALAFDQPTWSASGAGAVSRGVGRDVVILLDQSASMSIVENGRTRFDRAVERTRDLIRGLDGSRDRAALVFVRAAATSALPEMSANFDALLDRAGAASVTLEAGDAMGAISLAMGLLPAGDAAERTRSIVILSDGQATQWEAALRAFEAPGISVRPENVAQRMVQINTGIERFLWPEGGVRAGESARIGVRIRSFGDQERRTTVSLRVSEWSSQASVAIAPGAGAIAWFDVPAPSAESPWLRLEASIESDDFPADDALVAMAPVLPPVRVCVIASNEALRSPGMRALVSALEATGAVVSGAREAHAVMNRAADIMVIAGATDATPLREQTTIVRDVVEAGGGALVVLDTPALIQAAVFAGWVRSERPDDPIGFIRGRVGAEALRRWIGFGADEASFGSLFDSFELAHVPGVRAADGVIDAMSYADGAVLVSIAALGDGRVAMLNAAIDPAASGLGASPLFPVLMDAIVRRLSDRVQVEHRSVGDWIAASDESVQYTDGAAARLDDGWRAVAPGAAWIDGELGDRSVVIGIDAQESDLRSAHFEYGAPASSDSLESASRTTDAPLWPWLIAAALALAALELAVGGREARLRASEGRSSP